MRFHFHSIIIIIFITGSRLKCFYDFKTLLLSATMEQCRFDTMCWRPLCSYVHACGHKRARRWAELWSFLAMQEEDAEHIVEVQPQIAAKILEVAETIPRAPGACSFAAAEYGSSGPEKSVGEARLLEIAKHNTTAAITTVVILLMSAKPGLLGLQSTAPGRKSQSLPMKLGLLGLRTTVPRPLSKNPPMKLGVLGWRRTAPRQNPNSQCPRVLMFRSKWHDQCCRNSSLKIFWRI